MSMGSVWSIPMDQFIGKAINDLDKVARKTFLEIGRRVILRTPVRFGGARGGWQSSIGTAPASGNDRLDPSGRAAIQELSSAVSGWRPIQGTIAYLSNLVPYIGVLEHGRIGNRGSDQAPNGMVRITVAELGGIAQDAASGAM